MIDFFEESIPKIYEESQAEVGVEDLNRVSQLETSHSHNIVSTYQSHILEGCLDELIKGLTTQGRPIFFIDCNNSLGELAYK